MAQKLVIIGNGMAPGRMLEHLLETAPGQYDVTIFNAEPRVNYDRIMLPTVLSGATTYEQIVIHTDCGYVAHGIILYQDMPTAALATAAPAVTAQYVQAHAS